MAGDDELRSSLRAFLAEHDPGRSPGGSRTDHVRWQQRWSATLFDNGLAGPAWPRDHGGMDLSFAQQVIYHDELSAKPLPTHPGNGPSIAGPTVLTHGTPEQRERYLRPMLRGDEVWAQGFSEPEAGSDLPSLRTTGRRDGDRYIVNGQKIWSSYADVADRMFTLVRTGPPGSRADGISYLLIDLSTPGVTVRPITDLTGARRFCEVFLTDVVVPVADRVGPEHGGWAIARTTLGHERAARSLSQAAAYQRRFRSLVRLLRERGVTADPIAADRLADLAVRVGVLRLNAMRTVEQLTIRHEPGPASSIARLYHAELEQDLYELAVELLGRHGLVAAGDPDSVDGGRWLRGALSTRGSTIGAGTAEIQRNTIAEQILGLPRD